MFFEVYLGTLLNDFMFPGEGRLLFHCILTIYSFTVITIEPTPTEDVIKIMAYNMMRKHTKA